jgi:hypothetical protein
MTELRLCNYAIIADGNKIGDIGCFYLSKASWPFLKSLSLSTQSLIKASIRFMMTDVHIYHGLGGGNFSN